MIKAYWFDHSEHVHGYVWQCPHCEALNDIKEDIFVWNEEVKKQVAEGTHECCHCEAEDKHLVCKD